MANDSTQEIINKLADKQDVTTLINCVQSKTNVELAEQAAIALINI